MRQGKSKFVMGGRDMLGLVGVSLGFNVRFYNRFVDRDVWVSLYGKQDDIEGLGS